MFSVWLPSLETVPVKFIFFVQLQFVILILVWYLIIYFVYLVPYRTRASK